MRSLLFGFVSLVAAQTQSVHAQFGATARTERPVAAADMDEPSRAVTKLDTEEATPAETNLARFARRAPGVHAIEQGFLGAPAYTVLRGSGVAHSIIFFDTIPLNPDGLAFDLSTVPIDWADRIEIWRGGTPTWLGGSAIGGAIRIVPKHATGNEASVSLTAGSYETIRGRAEAEAISGATSFAVAAGLDSTSGRYPYVHDGGTLLDPADDTTRERANANVLRGHSFLHFRTAFAGGEIAGFGGFFNQTGGLPGPAIDEAVHTRRQDARYIAGARFEKIVSKRFFLETDLSFIRSENRITDLYREIFFSPTDERIATTHLRARFATRTQLHDVLEMRALGIARMELRGTHDELARSFTDSQREAAELVAELRLHPRPFDFRITGSAQVSSAELESADPSAVSPQESSLRFIGGARASAAVEVARGLAFSVHYGFETREPSMSELFGDGAFLLGDTSLRPERGHNIEAGIFWDHRSSDWTAKFEARTFASFTDDLIRYRRTAQYTAVPENIGTGKIFGAEVGARGTFTRWLDFVSSATWLDTVGESDRELPLRPSIEALAEAGLRLGDARVFGRIEYVGAAYADPQNTVLIESRTLVHTGFEWSFFNERFVLAGEVNNVSDVHTADMLGFPLPGRNFWLTCTARGGLR